ncbi:MAG: hypothetical protein PGN15_09795 [Aeromicrobium erythreum]
MIPDRRALGSLALNETPAKARKAYLDGLAAQEVHAATQEEAAHRAYAAVTRESAEIVAAVLSSSVLTDAVAEIARVAPATPPGVRFFPAEGTDDSVVAAAARLRAAEATLEATARRLSAHPTLGVYFAEDADRLALLWIDPTNVETSADLQALDRALRGVRPGAIDAPISVVGSDGSPIQDASWRGIRSAIAAAIPSVRFSLATTRDEFDDRVATFEGAIDAARQRPRRDDGRVTGEPAVTWQ